MGAFKTGTVFSDEESSFCFSAIRSVAVTFMLVFKLPTSVLAKNSVISSFIIKSSVFPPSDLL